MGKSGCCWYLFEWKWKVTSRVLLIRPSRLVESSLRDVAESLALGCLSAYLRERKIEVEVMDCELEKFSLKDVRDTVYSSNINVVGCTVPDPTYVPAVYKIAACIKKADSRIHFTVGGHCPTSNFREMLEDCNAVDSAVRGEGEEVLFNIVMRLNREETIEGIPGVAYRRSGRVVAEALSPLISDLDSLPFATHDHLDDSHVPDRFPKRISISGSRGCYANCGFCCIRSFYSEAMGANYRIRSVSNIASEIELLKGKYCTQEFLMVDDIFIGRGQHARKRAAEWSLEMEKRNLQVMLCVADRVDHIDKDVYSTLYKAGVRQVMIGAESTEQMILDYLGKGADSRAIAPAVDTLRRIGIDVTASFITFTPATTLEVLEACIRSMTRLDANVLLGMLNRLQVYDGTPIAESLKRTGQLRGTFPDYSYTIPDDRVEQVYAMCKACLEPVMMIAYGLISVEQRLRRQRFQTELEGGNMQKAWEGRSVFSDIRQRINQEAGGLMLQTIDYVRENGHFDSGFAADLQEQATGLYGIWSKELALFRDCSPYFAA